MHPLDTALQASIHGSSDVAEKILRSLPPDDLRVQFNLGWFDMANGDLKKGFEGLTSGRYLNVFGSRPIPGPIWHGESLVGKTLLFRCEGGFGDEICNFRFAQEFKDRGANVVIQCSKGLAPLFSSNGFVCCTSYEGVYYDYWVPAMSGCYVLDHSYKTLNGEAYLRVGKKLLPGQGLKVGIRWAGNPQFEHEQHRRFDPKPLIDLHKIPGTTFFSLQRDIELVDNLPFVDLRNDLKTWKDTAEIINGLDLVITSCTSIAHLSAALGVETWIIVPVLPYYLWALPGNKTKWYNSVTLFRQEVYGNWDAPLAKVKEQLTLRLKI